MRLFFLALFVMTAPAGALAQEPPVIQLSFDAGFDDEGPYRLKAERHGDGVKLVPGYKGQALYVDGTADWVDFWYSTSVSFSSGFTLDLRFRRADWENPYKGGSGWQTVAALAANGSLSITAPGCPLHKPWALEGSSSYHNKAAKEFDVSRVLSRPGLIKPGQWRHAVLVYDPAPEELSLYLDGELVDTAFDAPVSGFSIRHLRLGTWHKANQAFRGEIDEVAVYNYPRRPPAAAAAPDGR